jgi:anaerobic selenocysteine-containing dehydrogenase
MCKASAWDITGKGGWFPLTDQPGKTAAFGINSIRFGTDYEATTLFQGYPAKRNWYPLSSDVYEEIIPSMGDAYPYPIKAFFLYMGAPTYSLPAGHTNIQILCDLDKVPLFVANDILVGTTSIFADYIFPDTSFLERWEFQGSHPSMTWKSNPIRQPVIAPIPETCTVYGQEQPICFETMMMGMAEQLNLPGFGENAFGDNKHLRHMDEFMLRCVGNIAFGEKPDGSQNLPAADAREMQLFIKARRHLPKSVFDPDRWRQIVGEDMWPKVVYALNRGGRFENYDKGYKDDMLAHPYAKQLALYQEKTASKIHSGTGEHHPGLATWMPIRDFHGNEPEQYRKGYDLAMITNRTIVHTKSRTIANPWLSALMPDNALQVHPSDAARLGFAEGQQVKVVSATNPAGQWPLGNGTTKPMIGKVQVTQQVRPGVISFSLGFGHWATGAVDMTIDGHVLKGEPRRAKGIHANAAMWVDPALKNTCMIDPVGGSVSFYDTHVRLEPVA